MKKVITQLSASILLFMIILTVQQVKAQGPLSPMLPAGISNFSYTIVNDAQVSDKVMEFDLYLLDTDNALPFELANVQVGVLVNSAIINGGTITATIVAGTSDLVTAQQPSSITFASNCVKLASKSPPGIGSGTILSTVLPGTRICRIRLTNTASFIPGAKANLAFNFSSSPYATKLSQYIPTSNTRITCSVANCTSNATNIYLNAWQGGTSSDWATASNWNPNAVPSVSLDAFIPSPVTFMPVVDTPPEIPAVCHNLTISAGATVTVAAGKTLTLGGTLILVHP